MSAAGGQVDRCLDHPRMRLGPPLLYTTRLPGLMHDRETMIVEGGGMILAIKVEMLRHPLCWCEWTEEPRIP
jgi:hypothetical protein